MKFLTEIWQTWQAIFHDKGVLMMLLIAPVIYGFFYPWPYQNEIVNQVPVAVVDNDHSALSKKIITYAMASPKLKVQVVSDENQAKQLIWQDKIAGFLLIPEGLQQRVNAGQLAQVSILGNGGYFLLNKQVQTGFLQVIGTVSAGVDVKKSVAKGTYAPIAKANITAVPLVINPLYNTTEGYGSYVVPAVAILILQQMMLIGTAMLIGTWVEQNCHYASFGQWLARIFALASVGFLMGCFYYGWVFGLHDYPRNQNLIGSLMLLSIFCPTVVCFGCILGLIFRQRERAMQILIVSSMPMFFLSGVAWPVNGLPDVLQYLRWLLPTTPAINASIQLNQMGTSLLAVKHYLLALSLLGFGGLLLLFVLVSQLNRSRYNRLP